MGVRVRIRNAAVMLAVVFLLLGSGFGTSVSRRAAAKRHAAQKIVESARTQRRIAHSSHSRRTARVVKVARGRRARGRRHRYYEHFTGNSFVENDALTDGDVTTGEDPIVRAAAIDALGDMNGTAVAIDPSNGRILAMVNQKLALSAGAMPCSTIKLSVALAGLREGLITKDTMVNLGGWRMNLTQAIAKSNNVYFEVLGRRLGFDRVKHYANEFGLGELAGYGIQGEHLGTYPDEVISQAEGGVGRMCSFGEGVNMTPLQLGALTAAIANGGTLYYLQHPTTPEEVVEFQPRIKRTLPIGDVLPQMQDGMLGATSFGTARSLRASFREMPILGKTGTCSKDGMRFGWFTSYAETNYGRIVTVFFLEGGRPTFGPKAAELTGKFYRSLYDHSYFAVKANDSVRGAVGASQ
ncbi:MAG: penicillin-binding transpeptidase domain-containing protein [Acidobacteriaceae bacterium]